MPSLLSRSTDNSPFSTTPSTSPGYLSFIERFRQVNDLYHRRAEAFRSSLRLTFHARRHAKSLNLKVDIQKAVKCDPTQVSNIPLPIIATPLPVIEELQWVYEGGQSMPLSVGSQSDSSEEDEDDERDMDLETTDSSSSGSIPLVEQWELDDSAAAHAAAAASIHRPSNRPALRCVIPLLPRIVPSSENLVYGQEGHIEEEGKSYFSPDDEWSAITLTSVKPQPIPAVVEEIDDDGSFQFELQYPPLPEALQAALDCIPAEPYYSQRRYLQPGLEVPSDARRLSWGCGESVSNECPYDADYEYTSATSSASSAGSTSALYTPDDDAQQVGIMPASPPQRSEAPLVIRIKRPAASLRSSPSEVEGCDITDYDEVQCEKRPRFERKDWAHPYNSARRSWARSSSAHSSSHSSSRR